MFLLLLLVSGTLSLPGPQETGLNLKELDEAIWSLVLKSGDSSSMHDGESPSSITRTKQSHPSITLPNIQDLRKRIEEFGEIEITSETANLTEDEAKVLDLLVRAAKMMDPIFNRQAWKGYEELRQNLVSDPSEISQARLELFDIMRGPWDRNADNKPFAVTFPKPLGAGFYPEHMDLEQWENYIETHPDEASKLNSLVTMVESNEEGELVARNYSQVFREFLEPAHDFMKIAANFTDNESLKRFLTSRADAFISNDYYQSDKDWMDLDSKIEITIGPYEVYEDHLKNQKAAFEAFVTITDPIESEKLSHYKALLPEMEQNLPIPDEMKTIRGSKSPIKVVDLVFSSGEARRSTQTIAFNLPNDERVRKEKGSKKVMLKNNIDAKFQHLLKPMAKILMKKKQLAQNLLSPEAFFNFVLFHELSHGLGPAFVGNDETNGEVRQALGSFYSGLEEGKADVMGVYNILFMVERGHLPQDMVNKVLFTYSATLFRALRNGVQEAHARGCALQLNRYLEEGSIVLLPDQTYQVNFNKLKNSVRNLVRDICTWQHNGDKAVVEEVFNKYGKLDKTTQNSLDKLADVSLDIKPCFSMAGEDCSGLKKL